MNLRWVFTLDEYRYPLKLMRQLVDTLHSRDQHYIVMVDPAVAYEDYPAFNNGVEAGAFMVSGNGSVYKGVVWPGVTAFPDWFSPSTQGYWNSEFASFFDADTGVDIDALWIDMNEPSNFCNYPCTDPEGYAAANGFPPQPPAIRLGSPRPIAGFPADFQPQCKAEVTFNVNATTYYGENIVVFGSAVTIGNGTDIKGAAPLSADNYPIWSGTVDLPINTRVTYQFVRLQSDGSYVYETGSNRTILTGGCNSTVQTVNDVITTSSPGAASKFRRFTEFSYNDHSLLQHKRQSGGDKTGLPGRYLINPGYEINNDAGGLSNKTADTDIVQHGGYVQYDTHNIYGSQMSIASRKALLNRRPSRRPMIITRSTFAGSGASVGKWLGDNLSTWSAYLESIVGVLNFGALYQSPMVGADVCGFGGDTNENLCARWASLGAFLPFYRNHAQNDAIYQEFYLWDSVAESARNAIEIRYKLLDYIYTAMYFQSDKGTPLIQPMFFHYPLDSNTFALDKQYFWGPGLLVAPVTVENATTATFYLPDDVFYDYYTHDLVRGAGAEITLDDVPFTRIPLYYKGGQILAQRVESANTTTELRTKDFEIVIAPSEDGTASGDLYLDDGDSLVQASTSLIHFEYADGKLEMSGTFGYDIECAIKKITVLGGGGIGDNGGASRVVEPDVAIPLTGSYSGVV
jgi:alpha-glucosidase